MSWSGSIKGSVGVGWLNEIRIKASFCGRLENCAYWTTCITLCSLVRRGGASTSTGVVTRLNRTGARERGDLVVSSPNNEKGISKSIPQLKAEEDGSQPCSCVVNWKSARERKEWTVVTWPTNSGPVWSTLDGFLAGSFNSKRFFLLSRTPWIDLGYACSGQWYRYKSSLSFADNNYNVSLHCSKEEETYYSFFSTEVTESIFDIRLISQKACKIVNWIPAEKKENWMNCRVPGNSTAQRARLGRVPVFEAWQAQRASDILN